MTTDRWGTDVPVSMPEPIDPATILVDMGSHVITADGLKLYASPAVRQEMVANAVIPIDDGED